MVPPAETGDAVPCWTTLSDSSSKVVVVVEEEEERVKSDIASKPDLLE